jgi:hypothetical protein
MDNIINFRLMVNPWNWITILLMIYIVGLALSLIFHRPFPGAVIGDGDNGG